MNERNNGISRFAGRRPLALFAMLYGVGALLGYYCGMPLAIWALLALISALILALFRRRAWIFVLAMLLAGMWTTVCARIPEAVPSDDVPIEGCVMTEPDWNGLRSTIVLSDVHIDGVRHGRDIRLYLYGSAISARIGDKLCFVGDTWLPQGRRNPHGFDFRAWLWTRGSVLCATGNTRDLRIERPERQSYWTLIGALREQIGARIDVLFPDTAPMVRALLLGDRTALDEGIVEDFRTAGLTHLLAISGLHLSCLALAVEKLLQMLRCPRKGAIWITLILIMVYAALIGFPAPVVRSALMFFAVRGAILLGRPQDTLTSLGAAFIALLLARPLYIADAGFQLSFGAVFGLLLLTEPVGRLCFVSSQGLWPGLRKGKKALRWLVMSAAALLASSLAAQLIALPILAQTFGAVSLFAPLVNIIAIPITTLLLPLAGAKLIFGLSWFVVPDMLLEWLTLIAEQAARLPANLAAIPVWPKWLVALYLLGCMLASPYAKIARKWRTFTACTLPALALCAVLLAKMAIPDGLSLVFVDVGQADSTVIRAQGEIYVVDLGKANGPAVDYLVSTGQRPSAVFLTHPHADHFGGLGELLRVMPPKVIYIPECWDRVEAEGDVAEQMALAASMGIIVEKIGAGDIIALSDDIDLEVIQPQLGYTPKDGNGASLVTAIRYGEGAALLTGDLPTANEGPFFPDVDLLKAAHHGSKYSNSESLLGATSPQIVVFSVGRNSYGHPAEAALARVEQTGAQIYRTDASGAVFADISADGSVSMSTFLEDVS